MLVSELSHSAKFVIIYAAHLSTYIDIWRQFVAPEHSRNMKKEPDDLSLLGGFHCSRHELGPDNEPVHRLVSVGPSRVAARRHLQESDKTIRINTNIFVRGKPMIYNFPILCVNITYADDTVSSVHVKFLDQTEVIYDSSANINEVFNRITEQQKMIECQKMAGQRRLIALSQVALNMVSCPG